MLRLTSININEHEFDYKHIKTKNNRYLNQRYLLIFHTSAITINIIKIIKLVSDMFTRYLTIIYGILLFKFYR